MNTTEQFYQNYAALSLETRKQVDVLVAAMAAHQVDNEIDLELATFAAQEGRRLFPGQLGTIPEQELVNELMAAIQRSREREMQAADKGKSAALGSRIPGAAKWKMFLRQIFPTSKSTTEMEASQE